MTQPAPQIWLSVNGQKYGGWQSVRVTRGIERIPGDFVLSTTDRYPGEPLKLDIAPGQACMVQFDTQIVLTGWIDRVMPAINGADHSVTIVGRGRCCDLVDCCAFADNRQFLNRSVLDIATAVCKPFQISVFQRDPGIPAAPNETLTADGQVIPQININLQTTAWEIIESIARYASLLPYETETGDLLLAKVGTREAASGFAQGVNVQQASGLASIDQRYSDIWALALAVDSTLQIAPGGAATAGTSDANKIAVVKDAGVPRYRPLVLVSEQGWGAWSITERRASWEAARRYGRSQAVTLVTDSWADANGAVWAPNTLAPVDIPACHIGGVKWLISEVTFLADARRGRTAEITLMPPAAFTPEPPRTLFDGQLQQAINDSIQNAPAVSVGPAHA